MDRCSMEFIARRWWRRVEVWVIAALLTAGSGASQWSLSSWYAAQVAEVRRGYDEATKQRDMRLTRLANTTTEAAVKVEGAAAKAEAAAGTATEAAGTAGNAADKVNEVLEGQTP
ncbi:hypothetical protein [Pseudomonas viridiflava]|uniref:hypothetical protein n=1 Tax=Pseudomonas viridiflava TaxID=33069 RepID=UPI002ECF4C95|nr:hypothetical protein [Pseudomonas viridiflava]MEE3932787.1 hypothetical protein [Pseudomonas viridiflava]MEE3939697.1 hypothetical protein [Pseudomonas viridiflava]MEE3969366.1 hypothetical protein [Pseudomonas viridiflava]MEE3983765.1 hypothetical protein [Pseudomonas viridiflava]